MAGTGVFAVGQLNVFVQLRVWVPEAEHGLQSPQFHVLWVHPAVPALPPLPLPIAKTAAAAVRPSRKMRIKNGYTSFFVMF
jgi:hypothetical protein